MQYTANDYQEYESLLKQTKVKSSPNRVKGGIKAYDTWKWKNIRRKIPGKKLEVEPVSVIDFNSPTPSTTTALLAHALSPGSSMLPPDYSIASSPLHTRSQGKPKKSKDLEPFYKGWSSVSSRRYIHLLAAALFAGNTTIRNELVHVLDALLRLKQLTRKEYTDITTRLAASLQG